MSDRLKLHDILKTLIDTEKVYYQPPATITLVYPCIIYSLGSGDSRYADNKTYNYTNRYELLFIYKQPMESIIPKVLDAFQLCRFNSSYVSDNLHHYAFTLYY